MGRSSSESVRGAALRLVAAGKDEGMPRRQDDGPSGEGSRSAVSPLETGLEEALAADLESSFERLVRAYQDRLYAFAYRLCGRREDAEEVAQDAFVRAYRALTTYPAERIRALSLRAWLYRITLNVARNRFRRKRHPIVSIDQGVLRADGGERAPLEIPANAEERPDRVYEKRRARADVATLVRDLPDRYRAPILLRYVEDLPVEEVASILGQPLSTAKSNLHRGINALRESISRSRSARGRALEAVR